MQSLTFILNFTHFQTMLTLQLLYQLDGRTILHVGGVVGSGVVVTVVGIGVVVVVVMRATVIKQGNHYNTYTIRTLY